MKQKLEHIERTSQGILHMLQNAVPISPEEIQKAMRRLMDGQELQMFDLALFCEQEMIRAMQGEAYFAACLIGAAMNEALLALMCLRYEPEVKDSRQFHYSTRKHTARSYREVIGEWKFEQLISVAEELAWIPPNIVDDDFKAALAESFREVVPLAHPAMTPEEIEQSAMSLIIQPGTAMLRFSQQIRNAIHAGRWMRNGKSFVPEYLSIWSHFAAFLCGEIRLCLLHLILQRDQGKFTQQMEQIDSVLANLPAEYRSQIEREIRTKLGLSPDPPKAHST